VGNAGITGAELAEIWPGLPRLSPAEAKAFGDDIEIGKRALPKVKDKWA